MNLQPHIIKDVVTSDKEAVTDVEVDFKGPVKAIILNHGDHTYAKIRYDEKTMKFLENEMCQIDDYLTRTTIWRQLWF